MLQTTKTILAVLIAVILVGGGVYWYINSQQNEVVTEQLEATTDTVLESETQKEEMNMSFISCSDSLYSDNRDQYDSWKAKFTELYPNLKAYDAGAYCELNNGKQLISFSHFSAEGTAPEAGQTIILFDQNDNVIKSTENFHCQTLGDLGYPVFESLESNTVTMTCSSGDAGHSLKSTYELDLDTFEFHLVNEDTSLAE